ncbi:MAG TPA: hypothetical protein VIY10_22865 [Solirubrobacteraceae bacterium]
MAAALLAPAAVLADGDPASDVLASQAVYVPGDGGFAPSQTAQLSALVAEAQRAGVPIRVALIATQADLGSVTELWRQPRNYARFLGQELAQVYRGTLIVAMPAGFGIVSVGGAPARGQVGAATDHGPLVPATMRVVQAVAAADGHRLALPRAAVAPGSASALGSVDLGSWLALAAGVALIVAAWTASLRARGLGGRPPGLRRAR